MWGLPQKQNTRRADKIRLCGHLRRYKKIVKKTYIISINTYSNVKSDALTILLSNLIILSDLLHHLVHHFHIKPHHFMIQYTTLPFFKILQNTSKYKALRSYINLWKSIVRNSHIFRYFNRETPLKMYEKPIS